MRKFLLLFILFCGCSTELSVHTDPEDNETKNEKNVMAETDMELIRKFDYDGHTYIHFEKFPHQMGVVHDPDCECRK